MKKLTAVILALLLAASAFALEEEKEYALYSHPEGEYTLEYPAAWQAEWREETKELIFLGENGLQFQISREKLGAEMSAELFYSMLLPVYLERCEAEGEEVSFPDHGSIKYMDDEGDIAYCTFSATRKTEEGDLTVTCYFRIIGEELYTLTLTLPMNTLWEDEEIRAFYRTEIMHILESFALERD